MNAKPERMLPMPPGADTSIKLSFEAFVRRNYSGQVRLNVDQLDEYESSLTRMMAEAYSAGWRNSAAAPFKRAFLSDLIDLRVYVARGEQRQWCFNKLGAMIARLDPDIYDKPLGVKYTPFKRNMPWWLTHALSYAAGVAAMWVLS